MSVCHHNKPTECLPWAYCGGKPERACKPGFVENGHFSRTAVARRLKRRTRKSSGPDQPAAGCPASFLLGLAPGGVCLARPVTRPAGALLPHRFTLTATVRASPAGYGGLRSVALSLSLRTVGVTHHRVLWSPDFPPRRNGRSRPAQRPLGPLRFINCIATHRRKPFGHLESTARSPLWSGFPERSVRASERASRPSRCGNDGPGGIPHAG